ncbi:MAG: hypothetical protein JSV03_07775, partial [Planctomycetota bacterium]
DAGKLVWGLGGNCLLLLALLFSAKRTNKPTLAWLMLFALLLTAGFIWVRTPDWTVSQWLALNWPIAVSAAGVPVILLNITTTKIKGWHAFTEPLYLTGMFVCPIIAISGLTFIEQLKLPSWIPSTTFAILSGVCFLTALGPGPKSLSAVGALCMVIGIWHLRELTGLVIIPTMYFYGVLAGVVVSAMSFVFQERGRGNTVIILKWGGVLWALTFVIAGLLAPHF